VASHRDFRKITLLYGMKCPGELMFMDEISEWGDKDNVDVHLTCDQGNEEWKYKEGLITTLIPPLELDPANTYVAIVGPPVMYKFVLLSLESKNIPCENIYMSFERKMKCGIGKCGNCQIQNLYVCQDGPVFRYSDIQGLKEAL
jgi:NAD(P)H-flavin reductase